MTSSDVHTYTDVSESTREFLDRAHGLIIGDRVDVAGSGTIDVVDPATTVVATTVAEAKERDVDVAVAVANDAFDSWSRTAPQVRERAMIDLAQIIEANATELAELEVIDTGKPLRNARGEVALAASVFRYYAGWPTKCGGEVNPTAPNLFGYTVRQPLGVCGQITAWNYPFLLASWKVAPAVALGNSVVLKPPELTPLSSLRLGELCLEAGLPPGVLNVVPGYGTTAGQRLVDHPQVAKIAFTGSTAVGKHIAASGASTMKRLTLELGGKSPNLVFEDADLDAAADGALRAIFWNSGQVCVAGSRLFVQRSVAREFIEAVVRKTSALKLGPGLHKGVDMGPLVSEEHRQRVLGFVELGQRDGATLATGGHAPDRTGFFLEPTVFTDVKADMAIAVEEIFGPVLAVLTFDTEEDVVQMANDSRLGLAAAVWTRDVARAHRVARSLQAGTVWINTFGAMEPSASFGGFKESGVGRELGVHSLESYTEIKSVYTSLV